MTHKDDWLRGSGDQLHSSTWEHHGNIITLQLPHVVNQQVEKKKESSVLFVGTYLDVTGAARVVLHIARDKMSN